MSETATAGAKKVALITGANKGIGMETSRQLGKLGYAVLLGARDVPKGEAAAKQLRADGIDARAVKLDVTKAEDIIAVARMVESKFGKLDVLVNNAGVMQEKGWTQNCTSTTDPAKLRATFEANFRTSSVRRTERFALRWWSVEEQGGGQWLAPPLFGRRTTSSIRGSVTFEGHSAIRRQSAHKKRRQSEK